MGSQGVILIVDDSHTDRRYLERVLTWAGYDTVIAVDGQEALEVLQQDAVDMVVADIKMPRLDGYELFEATRGDAVLARVPFLFVTAYRDGSEVRSYGARIGAGPCLTKPVDPDTLVDCIARALEGDRSGGRPNCRSWEAAG